MTAKPLNENSTALDYLALHRELWMWLAENPYKRKNDWPRWMENLGDIRKVMADCFACAWAVRFTSRKCNECIDCLLNWGENGRCSGIKDRIGLYEEWDNAPIGSQKRADLARQIANLPLAEKWRK